MNIDQLQAGPEIDRLVAEKVMGFDWPGDKPYQYPVKCGDYRRFVDFSPSTDIAMAWAVLERVYEIKGNWICVEKSIDGDFNAGVIGSIGDPGWWRWATSAETAPLAICRAALKAVME